MAQQIYRTLGVNVHRQVGRGIVRRAQVEVFDLSADLSAAVALSMDPEAIVKAGKLSEKLWNAKAIGMDNCVYVIGPDDDDIAANKIGITLNPWMRLSSLQVGNWHRLRIKALVWVTRGANVAEKLAHEAAREMDLMLSGEWVNMSASEATELVLKAARYGKVNVYDSAAYLRNLASRTAAIAADAMISRQAA